MVEGFLDDPRCYLFLSLSFFLSFGVVHRVLVLGECSFRDINQLWFNESSELSINDDAFNQMKMNE
jgi:hypothetical protein